MTTVVHTSPIQKPPPHTNLSIIFLATVYPNRTMIVYIPLHSIYQYRTKRWRKFQRQDPYRRGVLLWCMNGRANPLMHRKVAEALSIYISIYLSIYLSIRPWIHPTIDLSSDLSVFMSIYLSTTYLSIIFSSLLFYSISSFYLSVYLIESIYSIYVSIGLSVYLSWEAKLPTFQTPF